MTDRLNISVREVLGIRQADAYLVPGEVVEVVGPNASGKSSLAVAAQALLAADANPLGLPAAESRKSYLHDGTGDGFAQLDIGAKSVTWRPKKGVIEGPPRPQTCRPEALGLIDFIARKSGRAQAEIFQTILLPSMDEVIEAVREQLKEYLPEDDLNGVIKMLMVKDDRAWENTESVYVERGRQAKRHWEEITGRRYGVKVAADWRPDAWLADYDNMTIQQAEEAVVEARNALTVLHKVQAISEAEANAAAEAAEALPILEANESEVHERLTTAQAEAAAVPLKAAEQESVKWHRTTVDLRKQLVSPTVHKCPSCEAFLQIATDGTIHLPDVDAEERRVKEVNAKLADAEAHHEAAAQMVEQRTSEHNKAHANIAPLKTAWEDTRVLVAEAKNAAAKRGVVDSEARRADLAGAEQAVEDAKAVVTVMRAEANARALQDTIARYSAVARAIGPQGVKAKMLENGLSRLNAGLRVLADVAKWPLTEVQESGMVMIKEWPAALSSESEKWRAQASIQLTLAAITKSPVVILDRADMLDKVNRKGLYNALNRVADKTGLAVMVCSTQDPSGLHPVEWRRIKIVDGETAGAEGMSNASNS